MGTRTPIDDGSEFKDIRLRQLLAPRRDASRLGMMPSEDFIDPGKLGDLMGWLFLYREERDPPRFLYPPLGPKIARRIGVDPTGKHVDEHLDARFAVNRLLSAVLTTCRQHRTTAKRRFLDRPVPTEAAALQLAGPEVTIDHLMALQILGVSIETHV